MKRAIFTFIIAFAMLGTAIGLSACNKSDNTQIKAIELMGAGDRIHDTYTFANNGVKLTDKGNNTYEISGNVDYLDNQKVKTEFKIPEDVDHVVAIKLSNNTTGQVKAEEVEISVNGVRNYDAEHLNGSDYTFIILEAKAGQTVTISVKWNSSAKEMVYTINMLSSLNLLPKQG